MIHRIMLAAAAATILAASTAHSNAISVPPEGLKSGIQEIELLNNVRRYAVRKASGHHRSYRSLKFSPEYTRHRAGAGELDPTR